MLHVSVHGSPRRKLSISLKHCAASAGIVSELHSTSSFKEAGDDCSAGVLCKAIRCAPPSAEDVLSASCLKRYSFQMLCSLSQTPTPDNCGTRLQDHRFAPLCTHTDPAIDRDAAFIYCGSVYLTLTISSHRLKSVTKTLRTARPQFIHLVKHWKSKRFLWYCALVGFCIGFAASMRVTAVIWYGILAVFLGSWWVINGVRSRREKQIRSSLVKQVTAAMAVGLVSLLAMIAFWPYIFISPFAHLYRSVIIMSRYPWNGTVLLSNGLLLTPHMAPRYSSPAWTRAKTLRPHPAANPASCAHDHS
jgi:hypothetical protein